jgi:hypothetical protein
LIWLKLHRIHSGTCTRFDFRNSPKNTHLLATTKRRRFVFRRLFGVYNLQTFQALKAKINPKQAIKNANQVMEEEDLLFQIPFFLQSANNPNPKQQKHPKPNLSKCNYNPSSSITQ